ncbi:MAG: asparagine synthase (glutamine-hydrolyzing) [Roseitalea sp.]|jgi:asparagine synthase (glutamine-hydrolysing)|nr:asparagine synthase (glutamine-hydrolyzing) [Roseitalea sp.]MBO6722769.1 asparagine synthase (glutamine-hydrolyzing) [Roseitalea sp.]MBO6745157.1 asparagine synthase (glutamine-hydrolyzing) [Roseitalea sp.]
MCGICGARTHGQNRPTLIARMLGQLQHRGPDDEGQWHGETVSLGHRRLSIMDLSPAGHQPIVSEDGRLIATVNGEIYNYPALRAELEARGARFMSNSDSEVVIHAYREYGADAFHRFDGMFALGLYDVAADALFVARDRLGIKPLYYLEDQESGNFLFASEIKALLAAAGRSRWRIDPVGLSQYLRFQNLLGDRTLFAGVSLLKPGNFARVSAGGVEITEYWRPKILDNQCGSTFGETVSEFDAVLAASVRRHLMSDVPVASYLSSGFDSTMVAAKAAETLSDPPIAFTGQFAIGGWYDEVAGARIVANHIGIPLNEVDIKPDELERSLDDLIYHLDEPRMGSGAFSQYVVAAAAAREFKVILTGHGGDELFSGYPIFKLAGLLDADRSTVFIELLKSIKPSEVPRLAYFMLRRLMGGASSSVLPLLFSDSRLRRALTDPAYEAVRDHGQFSEIEQITERAKSEYEKVFLTYMTVYLPGLLVVEDKISMAHSLEARTPFLGNAVVDFSSTISPRTKLNSGELKSVVKAAAQNVLPRELFSLPKRGFPTPLSHWLRGPLRSWLLKRLGAPDRPITRLFRSGHLEREISRYLNSPFTRVPALDEIETQRVWMLLCLDSWLQGVEARLGVRLEL